ncbi:MAG: type III ribulose-bisphosphate carboxylase [Candidatus Aenigmarchaeota archaeon]|nr:type III ribulose-bisphosphate carboxylase [Candidatus Aenigmarchaeota archaeon]
MKGAYTGFVNTRYKPTSNDLVCSFYVEPARGKTMRQVAEHVAGESSVGTWTEVATMSPKIKKMGAKVFKINGNWIKVAYPSELFEPGNMPQILSSIAGNIYGMKSLKNLRLEDIQWPKKIMRSFKGPQFGIKGIRKFLEVDKRPLCGTIIKPKLGLNEIGHAQVAFEAWLGGIDIVKDDENLTSQSFNRFEKRVKETLRKRDKAERKTGEKKVYMPNITAETKEMLRRAHIVKENNGDYVMVDVLTVGWSAVQTLRDEMQDLKLIIHAHRAMHGAITRNPKHGMSMLAIADIARLIGVDQLHIGTVVGKMEGNKKEVVAIGEEIERKFIQAKGHILAEKWGNIKPVFAVCSGGLHPGLIPKLVDYLGEDIIVQAGGGVHGHPGGTMAGAHAMRQAINSFRDNIPLKEYAKTHKELKEAIEKWGYI